MGGGGYFEVTDLGFHDRGVALGRADPIFWKRGEGHGFGKGGRGELAPDCEKNCSELPPPPPRAPRGGLVATPATDPLPGGGGPWKRRSFGVLCQNSSIIIKWHFCFESRVPASTPRAKGTRWGGGALSEPDVLVM